LSRLSVIHLPQFHVRHEIRVLIAEFGVGGVGDFLLLQRTLAGVLD
jgi:hypothetical protein